MASTSTSALRAYLSMIKVEHSVFALPFAMVGMMYASPTGWPGWRVFILIVLAMVSARSAAMAFNRIADRHIDAMNPRTAARELPTGRISLSRAGLFLAISCGLFFLAAALLNELTLYLSPIALVVLLGYSYTKRFTSLCHLFVGLSLGLAPAAAWVAVTGEFSWTPALWIASVTFWTAGFDVLYALQDEEFDRAHGIHSIPAWIGKSRAIFVSRAFHVIAVTALVAAGIVVGAGPSYFFGTVFVAGLLLYEQSLVRPDDLTNLNLAFFTLNGYVSVGFFLFCLADLLMKPTTGPS